MEHNVVRIKGTLTGGESWSINPCFFDSIGPFQDSPKTYDDLLIWATDVGGLNSGNVFPASIMSLISSNCAITSVRTEYWADNEIQMAAEFVPSSPKFGNGGPTKSYSTALVASLRTGRPGRSYRGRLYFPALAAVISSSTGRLTSAVSTTFSTDIAAWLQAVGNQGSFLLRTLAEPCVVSKTANVITKVETVAIGDVLDSQRRRRDALVELYTTATVGDVTPQ